MAVLNWIYDIIKLLKPKYYNKYTWFLLVLASSLISQPIWVELILEYTELKDQLFAGASGQILGVALIVLALWYNTSHRKLELEHQSKREPAHKRTKNQLLPTFEALCYEIYPILNDNAYIFFSFGPNSGKAYTDELRTDMTIWEELKKDSIIPNNQMLLTLLNTNNGRVPNEHKEVFQRMKTHLLAFKKHVEDPTFDHGNHLFPKEFPILIERVCFNNSMQNSELIEEKSWIKKRLKRINISEAFMYGSIVLTPNKAIDTDLVCILPEDDQSVIKKISTLKENFQLKFKKSIHLVYFTSSDRELYDNYLERNQYKIPV